MRFRLKAAGIHLLISAVVALIGIGLVFWVWHPAPLQKAVGVTHIFLMMLGIDVVLGPLLTLLVASSKEKKTLKFDLSVIAAVQLAAYLYGMHSIAVSRPVYIAFDTLRFEVVQADSVVRVAEKTILPAYQSNSLFAPQWVSVRPYKDAAEQSQRTFMELQEGISPSMQADLYQPLNDGWSGMQERKHSLEELKQYNSEEQVAQALAAYPQADGYLPLKAPAEDMAVLLDSKQKQVLGIVDLRPWKE
ncbi:TfpX/TfpZ family type IV pilin accessory protein [Eikenella sp. Marseille-P7795]|uniref:TfpX/TfpZ family type IV pilin accessory protein n=1 Tax=Eikenella sp. Marseille-P7795 TaxID=2866577 RepID=UPI001CE453A0|nr:TfpX/TfpZ family type IV pilin accessory protein [Eikenella sp. Marseille-P7795]